MVFWLFRFFPPHLEATCVVEYLADINFHFVERSFVARPLLKRAILLSGPYLVKYKILYECQIVVVAQGFPHFRALKERNDRQPSINLQKVLTEFKFLL